MGGMLILGPIVLGLIVVAFTASQRGSVPIASMTAASVCIAGPFLLDQMDRSVGSQGDGAGFGVVIACFIDWPFGLCFLVLAAVVAILNRFRPDGGMAAPPEPEE